VRGLALDAEDRLYVASASTVLVFSPEGERLREWTTSQPGFSLGVDAAGRVWVGQMRQLEIHSPRGELLDTWRDPERLGLITAIGFAEGEVFLADATARWIRRYDSQGRHLNDIGDRHRKGGFHIPNGVVDFTVDGAGILHVANPGMHRVERYTAAGALLGHFGRFDGRDPAGFGGCCNPTNLAVDTEGRIVVSEKAGPRVKLYAPEGTLLAVVADAVFHPGAKNMDVAVDSRGWIYAADTAQGEVRAFEPIPEGVA
jgi:sugar lactone lactonase YvrE